MWPFLQKGIGQCGRSRQSGWQCGRSSAQFRRTLGTVAVLAKVANQCVAVIRRSPRNESVLGSVAAFHFLRRSRHFCSTVWPFPGPFSPPFWQVGRHPLRSRSRSLAERCCLLHQCASLRSADVYVSSCAFLDFVDGRLDCTAPCLLETPVVLSLLGQDKHVANNSLNCKTIECSQILYRFTQTTATLVRRPCFIKRPFR